MKITSINHIVRSLNDELELRFEGFSPKAVVTEEAYRWITPGVGRGGNVVYLGWEFEDLLPPITHPLSDTPLRGFTDDPVVVKLCRKFVNGELPDGKIPLSILEEEEVEDG